MIAEINFVDKGEGVSLRDMVYFELKEAIMRGELAPGLRLMEIPIAEQLGVSRTPVREAIKRLEEDGLVIITPGCGAKVSGIRGKDVTDALDVRVVVETMAVRLAAKNIGAEQIEELKRINNEIRRAVREGNIAAISVNDSRLHHAICEAAGNKVLLKVMRELETLVLRYRVEYIKSIASYNEILDEHDAVIRAVAAGDAEMAAKLVESHIMRQKNCICEIIKRKDV